MMKWYTKHLQVYKKPLAEAPQNVIDEVREDLRKLQSDSPVTTVSIIGYNEEKRLLASLWSLSEMKCKYPVEIIGTNNGFKGRTAGIYEVTGIPYAIECQHNCGHARLCGLNRARGKYHINIDSDISYPPHHVKTVANVLKHPGVVAVSSLWGYIPDEEHSRTGLKVYEFLRDTYLWIQSIKRPELSIRGLVFAYRTDYARQTGIYTDIKRGEDGSLALRLKEYGEIYFICEKKVCAATGYGTTSADGSLAGSFKVRAINALRNVGGVFTPRREYRDEDDNPIQPK